MNEGLGSGGASVQPDQIRAAASQDINVWAGVVMPQIAIYEFPPFYQELWILCIKSFLNLSPAEKVFRLLLVLPRGHAKTTFVKLLVAYGLIHKLFDFILVVCASDRNASNFVQDIVTLLTHDNVRQLYGDWEKGLLEDNSYMKRASFMGRVCKLQSASVLSNEIRGTQKDMMRPDAIICDDVQGREVAASELKTEQVENALIGTVFKAKSPHRCGIIYMGNSYPRNCIADKLAESGEFVTLRTGAVLASGQALWPDLHSLKALKSEWRTDVALGKGHIWMAEVQNQPLEIQGSRPLFPDGTFPLTILPHDIEELGAFVTVDPAGSKKHSDSTAIGGHKVYEGALFELAMLESEVLNPRDTIIRALAMAEALKTPAIFIEDYAYQATLCFWAGEVLKEMALTGVYHFIPINAGTTAKLSRIRAWVGELLDGQYVICDNRIRADVLYQGLQFNALVTNNTDDILDTAAYGTIVRNKELYNVLDLCDRFRVRKDRAPITATAQSAITKRVRGQYNGYYG